MFSSIAKLIVQSREREESADAKLKRLQKKIKQQAERKIPNPEKFKQVDKEEEEEDYDQQEETESPESVSNESVKKSGASIDYAFNQMLKSYYVISRADPNRSSMKI